MKNKKLAAVIISFLVIVSLIGVLSSLLGFRLAKKNGAMVTEPDRLVGFLITTESIPMWDNDDIMEDNIGSIVSGKEIELDDNDLNTYQNRLYATVNKVTPTDEETGAPFDANKYSFEGVDGICFFVVKTDGYTLPAFDEGIFDSSLSIGASDTCNESISINGTVYVMPSSSEDGFVYVNYVYQSADSRIYAVSGTGILLGPEGAGWTVTQKEDISKNTNSDNQSSSFSGTISINAKCPAESVTVIQMNSNNEILSQDEFKPGELPDKLEPTKNTDYLLVETTYNETGGEIRTERLIISNGEESLVTIYYPQGSNWAIRQSTALEWAE